MKANSEQNDSEILLFNEEKDCCSCSVCVNNCPKNAISIIENEQGFTYPIINSDMCICCEVCKKNCAYQNTQENNAPQYAYAAVVKDELLLKESASGGVFAGIAREILKNDGVVFGCSMEIEDDILTPKHIMVERQEDLVKLQGSKYVQSIMGDTYQQVKKELLAGKIVLFSGTPCQVDALKHYLGKKEYSNLITIDLICHGVPGVKFFQDYIKNLQKKNHGKIIDFKFRDKSLGWGLNGSYSYIDGKGRMHKRIIESWESSYYSLFLASDTYRVSCYSCKYANLQRVGDLTIGDFWGIENVHPEYLISGGGSLDEINGISCILVNTKRGKQCIEKYGKFFDLNVSLPQNVAKGNRQLNHPSSVGKNREKIFMLYQEGGYDAVEKWYNKQLGIKKYWYRLKKVIKTCRRL